MHAPKVTMAREKLFNMRMSEDESARVARVAAHYGLNAASLFRMLVKREDDALAPPPTTVKEHIVAILRGLTFGMMARDIADRLEAIDRDTAAQLRFGNYREVHELVKEGVLERIEVGPQKLYRIPR